MKKLTFTLLNERLLYLAAVALTPNIPLFYLYSRNAAQGLLFRHFLVTGGVLAVISLVIYLLNSKFILGCLHAMIIIVLFWAAFWFFTPISKLIVKDNAMFAMFSEGKTIFCVLFFIGTSGLFLRRIEINQLVANTIAISLCLMFAFNCIPGVFAIISLAIFLPVSKFILKNRPAIIIIALLWVAFWFFTPIGKIIAKSNAGSSEGKIVFYLLVLIGMIGLFLRQIEINRFVANTIAILLCLMFTFNFIPGAFTVSRSKIRRTYNNETSELPYAIKTEFKVDRNLPKPNVYWLHMDGMVGFDAVERYFNDPQTELKNELTTRGFVINKSARLEAGYTGVAIPAMTSPVFYDSYLASELARVAQLTRTPRELSIYLAMTEKGFTLNDDIFPHIEILKAFSDAGYITIGNNLQTITFDVRLPKDDGMLGTYDSNIAYKPNRAINAFNILNDFKNLITDASALSVIKPKINELFEMKRPISNVLLLPAYQETVDKYLTGCDIDPYMAIIIRCMKYATSMQTPHFLYFVNGTIHCINVNSTEIGGIDYGERIGRAFGLDENGNFYKERLDDPHDVRLYLPQHKYAAKQMIAQVDIIIEDDPNSVIILEGDHGIHGIGPGTDYYDSRFMFSRGYSLEDQLNLNFDVISAVRIPPQYGKLSQPLDPLDITRYLVNNFVGKGNYDYLYYKEGGQR